MKLRMNSPQPPRRLSEAGALSQITHLCLRFHNIKSFSSRCLFQHSQHTSPPHPTPPPPPGFNGGHKNVLNLVEERLNPWPCATPLPLVYLCQLAVTGPAAAGKRAASVRGVHGLLLKIFCCNNTGKTQTNSPAPGRVAACMLTHL